MKQQIRYAKSADFDALLAIDQECFPKGVAFDERELGFYISRPATVTLVAELGGRISGFAVSAIEDSRTVATLVTLDVVSAFRRRGVGSILLQRSEELMRKKGALLLELQVATANVPAISFYRTRGFNIMDRLTGYYGTGQHAYRMEKPLVAGDPLIRQTS